MIDEFAKEYLHDDLRWIREAMLWKLDGLSEYDVRLLTPTGTNLLGLIKHLMTSEAWYLGAIFGRPFPEPVPGWDADEAALSANQHVGGRRRDAGRDHRPVPAGVGALGRDDRRSCHRCPRSRAVVAAPRTSSCSTSWCTC
jgi:hypothetical protein